MKTLAIIGRTGSTGRALTSLASKLDYRLVLIQRNPTADVSTDGKVTKVRGDVTDPQSLVESLRGTDYVISCFGPSNHKEVGDLMSVGGANIVAACEANGVDRLVFMSGFVQSSGDEFSWINRLLTKALQKYYSDSYNDKIIMEKSVTDSKLNWVIVRAAALKDGESKEYQAGVDLGISPFKTLSYTQCAQCLLDALQREEWTNKIVNVGSR